MVFPLGYSASAGLGKIEIGKKVTGLDCPLCHSLACGFGRSCNFFALCFINYEVQGVVCRIASVMSCWNDFDSTKSQIGVTVKITELEHLEEQDWLAIFQPCYKAKVRQSVFAYF